MWHLQKKYEESVIVINESAPTLSSGGIAIIADATGVSIRMVILPDQSVFGEPRREGQYQFERLFAHVSKSEIAKAAITPGKTKIVWNGNTYKVYKKMDYTSKKMFKIAEIEMRRKIEYD